MSIDRTGRKQARNCSAAEAWGISAGGQGAGTGDETTGLGDVEWG